METLESELTCPICLELFEDPLLLPLVLTASASAVPIVIFGLSCSSGWIHWTHYCFPVSYVQVCYLTEPPGLTASREMWLCRTLLTASRRLPPVDPIPPSESRETYRPSSAMSSERIACQFCEQDRQGMQWKRASLVRYPTVTAACGLHIPTRNLSPQPPPGGTSSDTHLRGITQAWTMKMRKWICTVYLMTNWSVPYANWWASPRPSGRIPEWSVWEAQGKGSGRHTLHNCISLHSLYIKVSSSLIKSGHFSYMTKMN